MIGYNIYAYCNNNPVMYKDINGEFPWLIATGVILLFTLTSCEKPNREDTYTFTAYDSYEDAYLEGMNNVYDNAASSDFQYEYGAVIVQYENDEKYYLSNVVTDRDLESVDLPFPKNAIRIANIHSHPWYLSEPYTRDGKRSIDQFIVDAEGNGYILPANHEINQWGGIPWKK